MREDLRLFINGREVEFSSGPKINYNYKETDLHNPTVVKNSFSKTVEIEGTNVNNDIFGHIWNLERHQYYGTGGAGWNPMQKAPFELYLNGELLEKGYVKLDKVIRANNNITYQASLFGSLGYFFYSLALDEGSDNNVKKSLNDLSFKSEFAAEPDLGFNINKETVAEAWEYLISGGSYDSKWQYINFMPAYNGKPNDFDAKHVLINHSGLSRNILPNAKYDSESQITYTPLYNGTTNTYGFSLGELGEEMTEWETFDLRSYLQRPVVRVERIIDAIRQPENNGGYEVDLDYHFFRSDNPYYMDAYLTLPMLRDMEIQNNGETEEISGATATKVSYQRWTIDYGTTLSSLNSFRMLLETRVTADAGQATPDELFTYRNSTYKGGGITLQTSTFVKNYICSFGVIVQLIGRSVTGEIVAASKAYLLSTNKYGFDGKTPLWKTFWIEGEEAPEPEYEWIQGKFVKDGDHYYFADMNGRKKDIEFNIAGSADINSLELKVQTAGCHYVKYKLGGSHSDSIGSFSFIELYSTAEETLTGNVREGHAMTEKRTMGRAGFAVSEFYGQATDYEAMFSDTYVPREKLLSTSYSPLDFLLSYCKLFGLYFYHDPREVSDWPETYPNGVIHIMDRDTFYTDEYVDLTDRIDRSRKMDITPTVAGSKWYEFNQSQVESEASQAYKSSYGGEYGRQLVNTSYNFDNNTTELYKDSIFKGGVMVTEKDKYFTEPLQGGVPNYIYNGLTYELYHFGDSAEVEVARKNMMEMGSINPQYHMYDAFPKLQLHGENNAPVEGDGILVFLNGHVQPMTESGNPVTYWLTDDVRDMVNLNGGTPCWILTTIPNDAGGKTIGIRTTDLPYFTRDLIRNGRTRGNITHSWNFGHPKVTFCPETYTKDGDSIYDRAWKSYINDVYNVDGKILSCYVLLPERPSPSWMRRFYFFDNTIWRLNEIKDWSIGSYEPVQCEFVKVQDAKDYQLDEFGGWGTEMIIMDDETIDCSGGTVSGKVYLASEGCWAVEIVTGRDSDGNNYYISNDQMTPNHGCGEETTFTINVPPLTGSSPITWYINAEDDFDHWFGGSFVQFQCGGGGGDESGSTGDAWIVIENRNGYVYAESSGGVMYVSYDTQNIDEDTLDFLVNAQWIPNGYLDKENKRIVLDVDVNNDAVREGTLELTGTSNEGEIITFTVIIRQWGSSFDFRPKSLVFDYDRGSSYHEDVTMIAENNWEINEEDE